MGDLLDIPISSANSTSPNNSSTIPATMANPVVVKLPDNNPAPNSQPTQTIETAPTPQPPPAVANLAAIPDVGTMQKSLEEGGKLLNEIGINPQTKIDTSPLAALQPQNMLLTQSGPQPIRLPSEHEMPLLGINLASSGSGGHFSLNFHGLGKIILKWCLISIYAALGSFSLLKAIKFFFYEFPQLEKGQALISSVEGQTNMLVILNLVILITAIILFGLAIQLLRAKNINLSFLGLSLMVAVICVASNTQIGVAQAEKLNSLSGQTAGQSQSLIDSLLNTVPFLKRQEDGTVTPVWYKDVTKPY